MSVDAVEEEGGFPCMGVSVYVCNEYAFLLVFVRAQSVKGRVRFRWSLSYNVFRSSVLYTHTH